MADLQRGSKDGCDAGTVLQDTGSDRPQADGEQTGARDRWSAERRVEGKRLDSNEGWERGGAAQQ